jgi:hypothetical protein
VRHYFSRRHPHLEACCALAQVFGTNPITLMELSPC